ncbi:MAG: hypothetical protein ACUVSX_16530 [Aggregatilineales bacterium]
MRQSTIKSKLHKAIAAASALALSMGAAGIAQADLTMPYGNGTTTYSVMNVGDGPATVVATYASWRCTAARRRCCVIQPATAPLCALF